MTRTKTIRARCSTTKILQTSRLLLGLIITPSAFAIDSACETVLAASEARIAQPSWRSISELSGGSRVEMIKANGQFFSQRGGKWTKFPVNIDDAERKLVAQVRSGEIKVSECKVVGSEVIDGMPVTVISSRTELKGAAPADSKLYIGKLDGLPYRQIAARVSVVYSYKGVVAPAL